MIKTANPTNHRINNWQQVIAGFEALNFYWLQTNKVEILLVKKYQIR
jgi:hypothetical protein